jgi:hypothetical protein
MNSGSWAFCILDALEDALAANASCHCSQAGSHNKRMKATAQLAVLL